MRLGWLYFPLRTAFAVSHRFWTDVFILVGLHKLFKWFLISWFTQSFLSRMVLSFQVFEFLPNISLWLSSSFRALWSDNMQGIISVFWYPLRPLLWPSIWSLLEKVPCVFKKNEYSFVLGCSVLYISMRSLWFSMSLKPLVFFLIFCLGNLSFAESRVFFSLIS